MLSIEQNQKLVTMIYFFKILIYKSSYPWYEFNIMIISLVLID